MTTVSHSIFPTSTNKSALDAAVKAQNLSAVQTGKLCTETNAFVISSAIGEQDFEADEGESVLKTNNIVGEWGLFLPVV